MRKQLASTLFITVTILFSSCGNDYTPKPRGYHKIDFPEKEYQSYTGNCPYTFDFPVYSKVVPDSSRNAKPCWIDITYPEFNGRVHLSYQPVRSLEIFNELIEDARTFAFKHTVKATAIDERYIHYPEKNVYGTYYSIAGNTASSVQFFLTDSTANYIRGALYFHEQPRLDSIQPVLKFIEEDIDRMIKTFRWKSN